MTNETTIKGYLEFHFKEKSKSGKTNIWLVSNLDGYLLGFVKWHPPWRCYSFQPDEKVGTLYEHKCLRDIADFIEEKTKEHKEK